MPDRMTRTGVATWRQRVAKHSAVGLGGNDLIKARYLPEAEPIEIVFGRGAARGRQVSCRRWLRTARFRVAHACEV